jgi:hypothetical protein
MSEYKGGDRVAFGNDDHLVVLAVRGSHLWVAKPRPVHERTFTDDDYYHPFTVDASLVKKYAPFFGKGKAYVNPKRFSIFAQEVVEQDFRVIHVAENSDGNSVAFGKLKWFSNEDGRVHWRYTTFNQYDYDAGGWTEI